MALRSKRAVSVHPTDNVALPSETECKAYGVSEREKVESENQLKPSYKLAGKGTSRKRSRGTMISTELLDTAAMQGWW